MTLPPACGEPSDGPPAEGSVGGVVVGTITVEITHRCHRRCAFCYLPQLRDEQSSTATELAPAVLTEHVGRLMGATGCRNIQLSGGEPLLRRDLLEIIDGLQQHGAKVGIITDGAQLDEALARQLAARAVSPIQPTLLAGAPGLHDALRGKGAFRQATRAIATGAAADLDVIACMVITRNNWNEAAKVAELAFSLGAGGLALSRFCPAGAAGAGFAALMPTAEQVRAAAGAAAETCASLALPLAAAVTIPSCVWEDPAKAPLRVGVCSLVGPRTTVTVGPDGSLRSCSLSTQSVGSLLTDPWEVLARRLWQHCLAPLREAIPPPCRPCPYWQRCLGGCRLSAQTVHGSWDHPDPLAPVG